MSVLMGYVTFKNAAEAKKICSVLVKKRLIACANILASHTTVYEWNGKLQSGKETAALIKTTQAKSLLVQKEIQKMHSYQIPCIVFWPLTKGAPDFLKWIQTQTRSL